MKGSSIEWCDHTFNAWIGCSKVSPGCAHCYAEARDRRFAGGKHWGAGASRQRTSESNWKEPLRWNAAAGRVRIVDVNGVRMPRPRVFCASLSDWLDEEVPVEWLADLLGLIGECRNLDWLLLTKRPGSLRARMAAVVGLMPYNTGLSLREAQAKVMATAFLDGEGKNSCLDHIWVGTTVEDQARADERIPQLLRIPAAVRFLSVEPMLEGIELEFLQEVTERTERVDWVIFGGESGPGARPCNVDWIRKGLAQCQGAGVAAFVKQLGARPFWQNSLTGAVYQLPCGDKKGGEISEWPADLRIREFPDSARVAAGGDARAPQEVVG